jgi:GntR family transcriptional regulator/MocR family aminotransferase
VLRPGPPLPPGGREHGEHQHAGQGERRRVAGARAEQAEGRRAEAVSGVVGEVPQGAGPGLRQLLDQLGSRAAAPGADEIAVIAAARERRLGLHGVGAYRGDPGAAAPPALVLGFGNVRERVIEPAIAAVADLLS